MTKVSSLRTIGAFINGRACSDTLLHVLNRAFDQPSKVEERAIMPMAGGIMQHGYQCGLIWGAVLGAGAQAYRLLGPGPHTEAKAILAAQRLVESFRAENGHINCLEITELDTSSSTMQMVTYFLIKGGSIGCFRRAGRFAPIAFRDIESTLSEEQREAPAAPMSCAALLAQKAGMSDRHATMVAGLAGGIGLCGGACGALGAAIWFVSMDSIGERGDGKLDFKNPRAAETIERFLRCTDYEFECSEIVGRKFENVADHASYLRGGGCAKVIEALADCCTSRATHT